MINEEEQPIIAPETQETTSELQLSSPPNQQLQQTPSLETCLAPQQLAQTFTLNEVGAIVGYAALLKSRDSFAEQVHTQPERRDDTDHFDYAQLLAIGTRLDIEPQYINAAIAVQKPTLKDHLKLIASIDGKVANSVFQKRKDEIFRTVTREILSPESVNEIFFSEKNDYFIGGGRSYYCLTIYLVEERTQTRLFWMPWKKITREKRKDLGEVMMHHTENTINIKMDAYHPRVIPFFHEILKRFQDDETIKKMNDRIDAAVTCYYDPEKEFTQ